MDSLQRCTSITWLSEFVGALAGCNRVNLGLNNEAMVQSDQRYTWRPWLSTLTYELCRQWLWTLRGCDHVKVQMFLLAVIERVWCCMVEASLCELEGYDCVNLEMHMEPIIPQVWRYTWRPWLSEYRECLVVLNQEGVDWVGCMTSAETVFIG